MTASDRGAATVLAVVLVQLLVLVALLAAMVGALALARMRVASVADVAALAAAQADGDPCVAAARSATANGMTVVGCTVDGVDVVVDVATPVPELASRVLAALGRPRAAVTSSARAGPPGP